MFVPALSGDNNAVAASTRQPDGYTRCHKSIEAAEAASGACRVAAAAWDGPAAGTKRPLVDSLTGVANNVEAVEAAVGACQVAAAA